ncbi:TrkH family potassium uptake protein [Paracoccus sp. S-4012]|uniref:TrkH family potassium uptake protein n=1 Tax=Paracoccus sp. S-4012 TaxID=2665648 RepID=UPI0012AF28BF|nr:TrkH family potassium uptake protein [Paracoccus sp. S-4012]MRX51535.1 TrkH family potassium uptake protein [Paracoccus sp. S-4012]
MAQLARVPLFVLLLGISAGAMLVPALQAAVMGQWPLASIFLRSAAILGLVAALLGLATMSAGRRRTHGGLLTLAGAYTLIPAALALPLAQALPDTGWLNAWWEMLSCLTTTGASLYEPARLPAPVHLWRGLVGWLGGLMVLAAAVAIKAPLQVGGFELVAPPLAPPQGRAAIPGETRRMARAASAILPLYAGATAALWAGLGAAGDGGFPALMRAMGTVSTSGIYAVHGPVGARTGWLGEAMVLSVLCLGLSRRFWPGGDALRTTARLRDDPELRLAFGIVALVGLVVLLRHGVAVADPATPTPNVIKNIANGAAAVWGAVFTALSYLTTTGWTSSDWRGAVTWSGLTAPGLLLAGLAVVGGGAATAAGGVKLLRIAALAVHSNREMERIVHPASVAGGGPIWRRLRGEGAFLAFVFFMLFAGSIAATVLLVTLQRVEFETATILAVAALTNTGALMTAVPLAPTLEGGAGVAGAPWEGWAGLPGFTKAVLAGAMVVGRLEIVAVLALLSRGYWRR